MTPNEYQAQALRTESTPSFMREADLYGGASHDLKHHQDLARLIHGMLGICTEAGELQDMVKKHLMYGRAFDPANVVEEIGDCAWYLALCLDAVGVSFEDCLERNIMKLRVRYPEKFSTEAALKRDLDAERKAVEGG